MWETLFIYGTRHEAQIAVKVSPIEILFAIATFLAVTALFLLSSFLPLELKVSKQRKVCCGVLILGNSHFVHVIAELPVFTTNATEGLLSLLKDLKFMPKYSFRNTVN